MSTSQIVGFIAVTTEGDILMTGDTQTINLVSLTLPLAEKIVNVTTTTLRKTKRGNEVVTILTATGVANFKKTLRGGTDFWVRNYEGKETNVSRCLSEYDKALVSVEIQSL